MIFHEKEEEDCGASDYFHRPIFSEIVYTSRFVFQESVGEDDLGEVGRLRYINNHDI